MVDLLITLLFFIGRPDPPSRVVIDRCRDDSATVKWVKGIENNAPVQYFIIQYNTSFYPDQWVSAKSIDYTQSIATVDLKPWGNYTFRVIAANKIGSSSPSLHTQQVCSTKPDRPDKNPRNLRALGDKRNTLTLQWTVSITMAFSVYGPQAYVSHIRVSFWLHINSDTLHLPCI